MRWKLEERKQKRRQEREELWQMMRELEKGRRRRRLLEDVEVDVWRRKRCGGGGLVPLLLPCGPWRLS
jgi:hypothetical protein